MDNATIPDCLVCGAQINELLFIKSGKSRKVCSKECALKYRTISASARCSKPCANCGNIFKARSIAKSKFCCIECSKEAGRAKPRKCKDCHVLFSPIRWQETKRRFISDKANNREYCSLECRHLSVRRNRDKECIACGVRFTPIRKDMNGEVFPYDLPTTCSSECSANAHPITEARRKATSDRMTGDKHPNWQGGSHREGFRCHGWVKLAEKVRIKAGRLCQHCGKTEQENGRRLDVHHKIPFHQFQHKKQANAFSNLEALCRPCHQKADWLWRSENAVQFSMSLR